MYLYIDTREKDNNRIERIMEWCRKQYGIVPVRTMLPFGDYQLEGHESIVVDTKKNICEIACNLFNNSDKNRFLREIALANEHGVKLVFLIQSNYNLDTLSSWHSPKKKDGKPYIYWKGYEIAGKMRWYMKAYNVEFRFCKSINVAKEIFNILEKGEHIEMKENIVDLKNQIKNIPMTDIIERYTNEPIIRGRIRCFSHNGEDRNMSVRESFCHCFTCGKKFDQISAVQEIFNTDFNTAINRIANDFGLASNMTAAEKARFRKEEEKRQREKQALAEKKKFESDQLIKLIDRLQTLRSSINYEELSGDFESYEKHKLESDKLTFVADMMTKGYSDIKNATRFSYEIGQDRESVLQYLYENNWMVM